MSNIIDKLKDKFEELLKIAQENAKGVNK